MYPSRRNDVERFGLEPFFSSDCVGLGQVRTWWEGENCIVNLFFRTAQLPTHLYCHLFCYQA
jgi:hypothetical protein